MEHSQGERSEDHLRIHQRIWDDLPANEYSRGYSWETQVSNFVSKLVRHEHSRERETEGAIHWTIICPKLIIRFHKDGGSSFTDRDCLNFIWIGSNKTRFQYCQNFCNTLLHLRAIQGHTGEIMSPEMLGHVLILHNWKEFAFHLGCSFNLSSMLDAGLIAGGQESRETRHTVFFTPLDHGVLKKKNNIVMILRDRENSLQNRIAALTKRCFLDSFWESTRKGIAFWQTKSHVIITDSTVPPDCIERVITQHGAGRTESKRCSQHCSEGAAGNCWQDTVRGSTPYQCCEKKKARCKSVFEFMEYHKTTSTKTESR